MDRSAIFTLKKVIINTNAVDMSGAVDYERLTLVLDESIFACMRRSIIGRMRCRARDVCKSMDLWWGHSP